MAAPRVTLIEDDEHLARLLSYNFEASGIHVEWIADGRQALDRVLRSPPDAIVLDWELPKLSGIEILRQIKAAAPSVPVMMLTGRADPMDRMRAKILGVDCYLSKPFSVCELLAQLDQLLETKLVTADVPPPA